MNMKKITQYRRTIPADLETPVGIYLKIRDLYPQSALLESSDYQAQHNATSFIGVDPIGHFKVENEMVVKSYPGDALYKEICVNKRIDMFEEGSRLFDIKRRNESIDRALSENAPIAQLDYINAVKYKGQDDKMIYMIPDAEIQNNPEITVQNP